MRILFLLMILTFSVGAEEIKNETTHIIFGAEKNKPIALIHPDGKIEFPTNEPKRAFEALWKIYNEKSCFTTGTTNISPFFGN